jgi:tetratricopeptide (TPR) repeat protein
MPATYNGIGTHYYGKRNVLARTGTCPHCHRTASLVSYDTRLWFVIVFIPVAPLGRKRIVDQCSACRRHYAMDLEKWETARQLETSGTLEKFRSNPTPENAIEAHRQLLAFQQTAEAAELQKTMGEKFADNARVHCYLGAALSHLGRFAEAAPCFERALELRPDLPEARVGVALGHLRAGRLEEARRLLDFMEKPGAAQLYSLAPLEQLALACQKAGRHTEALSIFGRLLAEIPALADHQRFRRSVQRSEKASRAPASILPKTKFSLRRWLSRPALVNPSAPARSMSWRTLFILLGSVAAVLVLALAWGNETIRRHRQLYVANGTGTNLVVEIPGLGLHRLGPGVTTITLAEGHYSARISGGIQQEVNLDLHANYLGRWFDHPVWILNPGGAALLVAERVIYSHNPQPGSFTVHFGKPFECLPEISHPFTPLPRSVRLSSGSDSTALTHVEMFHKPPVNAFYGLTQTHRLAEALSLAEWRLLREPDDKAMLEAYAGSAATTNHLARIEAFLGAGLTNRPVHIEWHRAYQDLFLGHPGAERLLGIYGALAEAEPTNSALLYLYGRICGDHKRGAEFYARARQADETNPYPLFATAYDQISGGDWQGAKLLLDRVIELNPEGEQFLEEWGIACLALQEFGPAEKAWRSRLDRDPMDWKSMIRLCDLLVAQGKQAEAQRAIGQMERAMPASAAESARQLHAVLWNHYHYSAGDFAALEQAARADRSLEGRTALFYALVEQGRLEEAGKVLSANDLRDPAQLLGASLAWNLAGKTGESNPWQAALLDVLHSGGADSHRAAALLEGKTAPVQWALDDTVFQARFKAGLLALLAQTHPSMRERLNTAARQLNVERVFPYHLVERATGSGASAK